MKLKKGDYIDLSEVDSQETFDKIMKKFKESGCTEGEWHIVDGETTTSWKDWYYVGWCTYDDGVYFSYHLVSYHNKISVDELLNTAPEEEDLQFSHEYYVEFLKTYIKEGYLNDIHSTINNVKVDLVFDLVNRTATITVNRESSYEFLVEDYSVTIPLPVWENDYE